MKNIDEKIRLKLIKRFYHLKKNLINNVCTESDLKVIKKSPLDMSIDELREYCLKFERQLNPDCPETETLRMKVIDAVANWTALYGREKHIEAIKVLVIYESGYRFFDEIPTGTLRKIYRKYVKMKNDFLSIEKVIENAKTKFQ